MYVFSEHLCNAPESWLMLFLQLLNETLSMVTNVRGCWSQRLAVSGHTNFHLENTMIELSKGFRHSTSSLETTHWPYLCPWVPLGDFRSSDALFLTFRALRTLVRSRPRVHVGYWVCWITWILWRCFSGSVKSKESMEATATCCVPCQLWIFLTTWGNNWSWVSLGRSTTPTDLEWLFTSLQMDVFVLTSTLDSNWMDSNATRTSVL